MIDWNERKIERLLDHWQAGCTSREVAERLTVGFGEEFTRNAVIAKLTRLRNWIGPEEIDFNRRK